jgi:hypothetical protein
MSLSTCKRRCTPVTTSPLLAKRHEYFSPPLQELYSRLSHEVHCTLFLLLFSCQWPIRNRRVSTFHSHKEGHFPVSNPHESRLVGNVNTLTLALIDLCNTLQCHWCMMNCHLDTSQWRVARYHVHPIPRQGTSTRHQETRHIRTLYVGNRCISGE